MTQNRKWLVLPPAVALLIVLGPMSMRGESAAAERTPTNPSAVPERLPGADEPKGSKATVPPLPRTPDLWQFGSTLVGVLLLGGVGLVVLRRLQKGPGPVGSGVVTLRQTLRLSQRQSVHALEFDGRLLLVGESDRGVQLLQANNPPTAADDEATLAARLRDLADAEDDGAVPKNMVLPRPPRRTPVADPVPVPTPAVRPVAAPATRPAAARRNPLGDFRALLAKAGR